MKDILKRNNVKITGNGSQTILFAHGFGCDQHSWHYIVDAFTDDYKVVLFDYVGAGKSDLGAYNRERYKTLNGYANDVLEICEALNLKDVIFVGHSVSSIIGLLAAVEKPQYFKRLVFIGPSPRYLNDVNYTGGFEKSDLDKLFEIMDSNYLGWSKTMAPVIMGHPNKPFLGEELANSFCATDPEIAKEFARVTFLSDNRKDLPKLEVESLTLQCSNDIIAPLDVGYYMKEHTPQNKFILLKATGHCPHMSAPEETIEAIKSFI